MEQEMIMTKPDTPAIREPYESKRFLALLGFRHTEKVLTEERYDSAGVAGVCFAMMGLIVLLRVALDLVARLFGWW